MKTIYFGYWDNYLENDKERQEGIDIVIDAVEREEAITVSFSYNGRTRHEIASHNMVRALIDRGKDYEYNIGYNYVFEIYKNDNIRKIKENR